MEEQLKSGFVTLIGRPNVGKSTLMNHLIGQKIAITSDKPQTTRNRIQTVYTDERGQIIFLDTPGIHKAKNKLGQYMVNVAEHTLKEVDVVMWLVEPTTFIGAGERHIAEQLRTVRTPVILVINKIDTVEKETLLPVIAAYKDLMDFTDVIPISAKWHDGLDSLMQVCESFAQPGPFMFPEGISTDMPEKQVMAEIIREKLLWNLEKEIPHGTAVEVTKFSERDDGIIDLDATIYCEKASHKGIIIGKNGQMLKKISSDARKDCERFMGTKVFLQTWVRVKENWRDSDFMISNFGYHKD